METTHLASEEFDSLSIEQFQEKVQKIPNMNLLEVLRSLTIRSASKPNGDSNPNIREFIKIVEREISLFLEKSRNVKSHYVGFCQETQLMLASMLSLTDERKKLLSFECTSSEPEYPEKILNLKWSLYGDWRTFAPGKYFQNTEKAMEIFINLFKFGKDQKYFEFGVLAGGLYSMATDLRIEGKDFDTGVENLFKLLSSKHEGIIGEESVEFPLLIIHRHGREDCYFYEVYIFMNGHGSFINIQHPKETPNFVKRFFELRLTGKPA